MVEDNQESYSDAEEAQDNYFDEQREMWEEQVGGNYPAARKDYSLFSLFKGIWKTTDSSKVANLDPKTELGNLNISVRDAQKISFVAGYLNHPGVENYFRKLGEITLSTSMSKKGWLPELFVTSKKYAQKGSIENLQGNSNNKKSGWRILPERKDPMEESL